jgi:hypothetical protein
MFGINKDFFPLVKHFLRSRLYIVLNVTTLGQVISDYNNKTIKLSKVSFPLKETSFRRPDLPKLIFLSD